ncbi:MAG: hypothetical protein ACRCX2_29935 [Paraclostridium sp.]
MMIIDDMNKKELYESTMLNICIGETNLVEFGSMKGMPCTMAYESIEPNSVLSLVEKIEKHMVFINHDKANINHEAFAVFVDLCHQNNIFVLLMTRTQQEFPIADWTIMLLDRSNEYKFNYDNCELIGEYIISVDNNFDICDVPPSVLAMHAGGVWVMPENSDLIDNAKELVFEHNLRLLEVNYV